MENRNKNKNTLTFLLIIVIAIIVGIIGYLAFEIINTQSKEKGAQEITDQFDNMIPTISEAELAELEAQEYAEAAEAAANAQTGEGGDSSQGGNSESGNGQSSSSSGSSSGGTARRTSSGGTRRSTSTGVNINGLMVYGTIRIPATNIKYSIFDTPSTAALDRGVAVLYSANGINRPGNTVIAGHNYRNRSFFSRNKTLKSGDQVIIKDVTGVEVTYIVYYSFTTNSIDASFYQRDTAGKREITLSTCTDNGTRTGERLIIYARER